MEKKGVLDGPVITTDSFSTFQPQGSFSGSEREHGLVGAAGRVSGEA